MIDPQIHVGIDVGCKAHRVGIADPDGKILEEFDISHTDAGFQDFFGRIEHHKQESGLSVAVAMEGFNGYARPLDQMIQERGYRLYNVNNMKLARFKEVFPGAAKTDAIDTRKILELFHLKDHLPLAKDALQEVVSVPKVNDKLKRLSRRRRQLVNEKVRVVNRIQADLQAVCPELLAITNDVTNLWFLRFISSREDLRKLSRMRRSTLLKIPGVGRKYARLIQEWQAKAHFSGEVDYVGSMIVADARRLLELMEQINGLDTELAELADQSEMAKHLSSIPGFGKTSIAELAGEIGTIERFTSEGSLALYVGMSPLSKDSGQRHGSKSPRHVNRRARAAMMTTVARHIDCVPESKAYYDKKRAEGKRHNQAVRSLGRHLVRVIWSMLRNERDYELRTPGGDIDVT
jgi:transposase